MIDLSDIFLTGTGTRFLQDCRYLKVSVHGEGGIVDNLNKLKNTFLELNDVDSSNSIQELIDWFSETYEETDRLDEKGEKKISKEIILWKDRLIILLKNKKIFEISKQCSLNVEMLLNDVKDFFDEKHWNKFDDLTKHDLKEAGKCILLSAPTAASMLLLRAMEGVLRIYYEKKKNEKISEFRDWDEIVQGLKDMPNSNRGLLDHLNYLRLNLRNPAQHPEKIFTNKEAESIFAMVRNTIEEIYSEI